MSIRLDPRRLGVLKRLAADAGVRPGDLVLVWVEERLDAERTGAAVPPGASVEITKRLDELTARIVAGTRRAAAMKAACRSGSTRAAWRR